MFKKWWSSSIDPQELSLTLKGALLALVPLVMILARIKGSTVSTDELTAVIDQIALVVQIAFSIISPAIVLVGLVRKVAMKIWDMPMIPLAPINSFLDVAPASSVPTEPLLQAPTEPETPVDPQA